MCVIDPFKPTSLIRDANLSQWIAGLPAAFAVRKLEAVKLEGSDPPACTVQVINGFTRHLRGVCFLLGIQCEAAAIPLFYMSKVLKIIKINFLVLERYRRFGYNKLS